VTDEEFLRRFEAAEIALTDWRHREHIKVAYLYLCRYPRAKALDRLRHHIQALNSALGVPESPGRGYHETITQAWLRLVEATLREDGPAENAQRFYEMHPELSQPRVLRLFYSRTRLMSAEAKSQFVEPDLASLPRNP
jgi:hypothetical protein